jgi:hypothetical protein
MTLETSNPEAPRSRAIFRYGYIAFSIVLTSLTAAVLSVTGYIPLDPVSAAVTGGGAGLALVIFNIYYMGRMAATSRRFKTESTGLE